MYKLLLVDDESEIRNGLSQYFPWDEVGFEIIGQCDNGRKALDFILANPVDAVLCDIRMPVMDGIEVARQLHERQASVKVVFLSGYRDFEYAKLALDYQVKNYIVKPTKFKELNRVFSALRLELDREAEAAGKRDPAPAPLPFNDKIIAEIKSYVESCYRDATLEEAARRVHMNPFYVSKFFKEKTGQTFSDYVVSVRMKKAAELLMDIRYKTYEVSEMVGYSHAKNFTRTFKKFFGKSPKQFRNDGEGEPTG